MKKPCDFVEFARRKASLKLPATWSEATPGQRAAYRALVAEFNAWLRELQAQAQPGDAERFQAYLAAGGDFENDAWRDDPRTPPAKT